MLLSLFEIKIGTTYLIWQDTRLKGYQILESYTLNFLKGLQIYRTKK